MNPRCSLSALVLLVLAGVVSGQLSGAYSVDPTGSGGRNFRTLGAAVDALKTGICGPVTLDVASSTFKETVRFNAIPGASRTCPVTFVARGKSAVIDARGACDGVTLADGTAWLRLQNLEVIGWTRNGLRLDGKPAKGGAHDNRFTSLRIVGPATGSNGVRALQVRYSDGNTFTRCTFRGGWAVVNIRSCCNVYDSSEIDGQGLADYCALFNDGLDCDNVIKNCFIHGSSPRGYALGMCAGSFGNMIWHNTILTESSASAVQIGGAGGWKNACSFRNNICINLGTGSAVCFRLTQTWSIDEVDSDYNCYFAPNAKRGTIESDNPTFAGSLRDWQAYQMIDVWPPVIKAGGATSYDAHSIEADPWLVSNRHPIDTHLMPDSPARDQGTTRLVQSFHTFDPKARVTCDRDGDPRDNRVDIGADEMGGYLTGSGKTTPGSTVTLHLTARAGRPYQVASALGDGPTAIGPRNIGLSFDGLVWLSVNNALPKVFENYAGVMDGNGLATARLNIPRLDALRSVRIHSAFLTLDPSAPLGIGFISNTFRFAVK